MSTKGMKKLDKAQKERLNESIENLERTREELEESKLKQKYGTSNKVNQARLIARENIYKEIKETEYLLFNERDKEARLNKKIVTRELEQVRTRISAIKTKTDNDPKGMITGSVDKLKLKIIKYMPTLTVAQKERKLEAFTEEYSRLEDKVNSLKNDLWAFRRKSRIKAISKFMKWIKKEQFKLEQQIIKRHKLFQKAKDKTIGKVTTSKIGKALGFRYTIDKKQDKLDKKAEQSAKKEQEDENKELRSKLEDQAKALLEYSEQRYLTKNEQPMFKLVSNNILSILENNKPEENIKTSAIDSISDEEAQRYQAKLVSEQQAQTKAIEEISENMAKIQESQIDEQDTTVTNPVKQDITNIQTSQVQEVKTKKTVGFDLLGLLGSALAAYFGKDLIDMFKNIKKIGLIAWFGKLLKDGLKYIIEGLAKVGSKVGKFIADAFSGFKDKLMKVIEPIEKFIKGITQKIANFGSMIKDNIAKGIEKVKKVSAGVADKIKGFLGFGEASTDGAKKVSQKMTQEAAEKAGVKGASKGIGKAMLKKIPGIGLIAGLGFALGRLADGDITGAGLEIASGALSMIPGLGTTASVAVDAYSIKRDIDRGELKSSEIPEVAVKPQVPKDKKEEFVFESSKVLAQEFKKFYKAIQTGDSSVYNEPQVILAQGADINNESLYNSMDMTNDNILNRG